MNVKTLTKNNVMKIIKTSLIAIVLMTLCFNSYSQLSVTSYSIYSLGINTNQNNRISGELKTFTNRDFDDLLLETDIFYNMKPSAYHRFSIGLGLNFMPFREFDRLNAFTIPVQLEIYPLQEFRKLSLIFELTPEFIVDGEAQLRNLWGIRYTFGKPKD
jgi:hypothetical protein